MIYSKGCISTCFYYFYILLLVLIISIYRSALVSSMHTHDLPIFSNTTLTSRIRCIPTIDSSFAIRSTQIISTNAERAAAILGDSRKHIYVKIYIILKTIFKMLFTFYFIVDKMFNYVINYKYMYLLHIYLTVVAV